MSAEPFDVVVIGGGVVGLSAIRALRRRGVGRVALVEQFDLGHDRGSSHGASRITRSTYADPRYVELMAIARAEDWPALEHDAGTRPIHPTLIHKADGCFFGPAGDVLDAYAAAVSGCPDVTRVSPAEGRRRFPAFRFEGMDAVFDDRTAGLIDAGATLKALRATLHDDAVRTLEATRVLALLPRDGEVVVRTTRGDLVTPRVIVAAGAWTDRLVPSLGSRLNVVRQTVGYFAPGAPSALGELPVWACLGDEVDITHYGLPEFGGPGLKVGRHVVIGDDEPDDVPAAADPAAIAALRCFLDEQLTAPPGDLLRTEHCLYTCTPTEDFVIDIVRDEPRVVVAAGMSGHGFKFAPLTGRLLAELALDGKTSVPAFEQRRPWR